MPSQAKPLLLLDVDGVINRFGIQARQTDAHVFRAEGYRLCVPRTADIHVGQLAERFEMHWATAWEDRAHMAFAEALGLDPHDVWPHVKFDRRPWSMTSGVGMGGASWKLPTLRTYVGERPFCWIDDDVPSDARDWVRERNASYRMAAAIPSAVVITDPSVGLNQAAVDRALLFAESLQVASA